MHIYKLFDSPKGFPRTSLLPCVSRKFSWVVSMGTNELLPTVPMSHQSRRHSLQKWCTHVAQPSSYTRYPYLYQHLFITFLNFISSRLSLFLSLLYVVWHFKRTQIYLRIIIVPHCLLKHIEPIGNFHSYSFFKYTYSELKINRENKNQSCIGNIPDTNL